MIICSSVTRVLPAVSVTCQRHQIFAPGGSEPDCFISHDHATLTVLSGWTSGKVLATNLPQVICWTLYSRVTSLISTLLLKSTWKVILFGKAMTTWLLAAVMAGCLEAGTSGAARM